MWVLFLAVASFVAFLGVVLLLWLADVLEARSRDRRSTSVQPPFTVLCIAPAFEPEYAAVREAPIHALELIRRGVACSIHVTHVLSPVPRSFIPLEPVAPELDARNEADHQMANFPAGATVGRVDCEAFVERGSMRTILPEVIGRQGGIREFSDLPLRAVQP